MRAFTPFRMPGFRSVSPILTLVALVGGCASPGGGPAGPAPMTPEQRRLAEQADSVRRHYTRADIDFMTGMIGHHAQAIVISRWAPSHGASPAILRLTERIINAQQDEIATMRQWLLDRGQEAPDPEVAAGHDDGHGHDHGALMPGMLTPAQLAELDQARGPAFDRLFLRFMIQHHSGALTMVEQLFASHGAGQDDLIFKLASDIHTDQVTEIARMERMLDGLDATPAASP